MFSNYTLIVSITWHTDIFCYEYTWCAREFNFHFLFSRCQFNGFHITIYRTLVSLTLVPSYSSLHFLSFPSLNILPFTSCSSLHFLFFTSYSSLHFLFFPSLPILPFTSYSSLHFLSFPSLPILPFTSYPSLHFLFFPSLNILPFTSCSSLHFLFFTSYSSLHFLFFPSLPILPFPSYPSLIRLVKRHLLLKRFKFHFPERLFLDSHRQILCHQFNTSDFLSSLSRQSLSRQPDSPVARHSPVCRQRSWSPDTGRVCRQYAITRPSSPLATNSRKFFKSNTLSPSPRYLTVEPYI